MIKTVKILIFCLSLLLISSLSYRFYDKNYAKVYSNLHIINSNVLIKISYTSHGSGILISDEGHVLTNKHVAAAITELSFVKTKNGKTYKIEKVEWLSKDRDLAVIKLKVKKDELRYVKVNCSLNVPKRGDRIKVIGNPLMIRWNMTFGRVTSFYKNSIVTDANIYKGNSGGGLFDSRNRLIGVVYGIVGIGINYGLRTVVVPTGHGLVVSIKDFCEKYEGDVQLSKNL